MITNNIKLIFRQLVLNFRYFISNKKNIFFFFLPVIFGSLVLVAFLPVFQGFSLTLEISLIPSLSLMFATLSFNFTNSTLYSNIKVSNNNKYNFNISIFISLFLASLLILFSLLILLTIFSELHFLSTFWLSYNYEEFKFIFFNDGIWLAIISSIEISAILFSISFFFTRITNNERNYYILIIIIILLSIVFGGVINTSFYPRAKIPVKHNPIYTYMVYQGDVSTFKTMFIPSLFFPSGILAHVYAEYSMRDTTNTFYGQFANIEDTSFLNLRILSWQTKETVPPEEWCNMWRWNTVLLLPVFWTLFFGSLGIFVSKIKNK